MPKAKRAPVSSSTSSSAKPTAFISPDTSSIGTLPPDVQEEIRRRAYELYEQRGGENGSDLDDWLRAEEEVLGRFQRSA